MKYIASMAVAGGILVAASAGAEQSGVFTARLDADVRNIGVCERLIEPATAGRPHTITVGGGAVTAKSAGGLNFDLKAMSPDIYQSAKFVHRGTEFIIVVDLTRTPSTVVVTDRTYGCRWHGEMKK